MPVKNRFAELLPEIKEWRHDLHQNPEILFETHRTSAMVEEKLKTFGCDEVVTGIGRTGVVGVIGGKSNTSGKVIGLRADMDALPIHEQADVPYKSKVDGAMHACGHDGHTSMLLGAAKYLAETRNFDGTVVLIFQPAEEGGGGGREMCEDGLMERWGIQEVYGMHNWPGLPTGKFAIRTGPFFASADQFDIVVEGKGGHAAKPYLTIDTTVVASHIVIALQTISSRIIHPAHPIVVSVTSFETATKAHNIIPQTVRLRGTVRAMSEDSRLKAKEALLSIAQGTAASFGATADVNYRDGYPVMVNSDEQTEFAAKVAASVAGDCAEADITMGGEDFAFMSNERPGAYILVGNGNSADVHHPEYVFDDETMPAGCSWWAEIVEQRMPAA